MSATPFFQDFQDEAFKEIQDVFGQDATWEKEGGEVTGQVLFNDPTQEAKFSLINGRGLNHVGYDNAETQGPSIEFAKGQFEGLFEKVYTQDVNQYIRTGGVRYVTINSSSLFDGQTYVIFLAKANTEPVIEQ